MFEFLLQGRLLLDALGFPLFLLLLQVVDLLLQHLYVQLQLLLDLDMVSNLSFVVLQLRLILLRRQFY